MKDIPTYLDLSRRVYKKIFHPKINSISEYIFDQTTIQKQDASDLIRARIIDDKPLMIARLGTELYTLLNYKEVKLKKLNKAYKFIKGELHYYHWNQLNIELLCSHTGFFPATIQMVERFSELLLEEMKNIDIWGEFSSVERYFDKELSLTIKIRLFDIEPFIHNDPWSEALEGKKVLVVHPFEDTIISQYRKRELIFSDKRILPNFELKTLKAVQTIAGNNSGFRDWFEALNYMKEKISNIDFDVSIIGCGAYGMPLAAYVKSIGKKAIHLGGATQLLFGIKGKRWENHPDYSYLINEYWVRPLLSETPTNYQSIEDGCYW